MEGAGAGEGSPALPSPKLSFDLPPAPIASALSAEALEELKAELTTLMEEQIAQAKAEILEEVSQKLKEQEKEGEELQRSAKEMSEQLTEKLAKVAEVERMITQFDTLREKTKKFIAESEKKLLRVESIKADKAEFNKVKL